MRWLVLAAALPWACDKKPTPAPPAAASRPPIPAPSPSQIGVRLNLPEGWTASSASEEELLVGPKGRLVMRLNRQPGQGDALPSPATLHEEFARSAHSFRIIRVDEMSQDGLSLAIFELGRNGQDGGTHTSYALLGARRAHRDLILCSSEPGASEEDVRETARACRELSTAER